MEDIVKQSRFVYVVYSNGLYTVEANRMHPSGKYTMNVRGSGVSIEEATLDLVYKIKNLQ